MAKYDYRNIPRQCLYCGNGFLATPSQVNAGRAKFCSPQCGFKGRKKNDPTGAERFARRVNKDGPIVRPELGPCWIWTGTICKTTGYGLISVKNRHVLAHRLSWQFKVGPIPEDLLILHHCDNRPCVRPFHLFVGTQKMNIQDMVAKGRSTANIHPQTKLSLDDIATIRQGVLSGVPQLRFAERFKVSPQLISSILGGKKRLHA